MPEDGLLFFGLTERNHSLPSVISANRQALIQKNVENLGLAILNYYYYWGLVVKPTWPLEFGVFSKILRSRPADNPRTKQVLLFFYENV